MRHRTYWTAWMAAGLLSLVGCRSTVSPEALSVQAHTFRPNEERRGDWLDQLHAAPSAETAPAAPVADVAPAQPAAPSKPAPAEKPRTSWWHRAPREPAPEAAAAATTPAPAPPKTEAPVVGAPSPAAGAAMQRRFERGDRVLIALLGIPDEVKIEDVVDDKGMVTLPLIGDVHFEGRTTSEVESEIERIYVERLIYTSVNATVVAPDDEFFVRGEVRKEGRYALTGAMTLSKAIAVAGGYTEFANRRIVVVRRGEQTLEFNVPRIDDGLDPDPLLTRGDVVTVRRRHM